jgi:hypothetical protein
MREIGLLALIIILRSFDYERKMISYDTYKMGKWDMPEFDLENCKTDAKCIYRYLLEVLRSKKIESRNKSSKIILAHVKINFCTKF